MLRLAAVSVRSAAPVRAVEPFVRFRSDLAFFRLGQQLYAASERCKAVTRVRGICAKGEVGCGVDKADPAVKSAHGTFQVQQKNVRL